MPHIMTFITKRSICIFTNKCFFITYICFSDLCEAHELVRTKKLVVPCLNHNPVCSMALFTVIVSKVWYKHTRPGDGNCTPWSFYRCTCVLLLMCFHNVYIWCIILCKSLYNQHLHFYFNALQHRLSNSESGSTENAISQSLMLQQANKRSENWLYCVYVRYFREY